MAAKSKNDILVLIPLYKTFKKVLYKGKPVSAWKYIVVAQVCVDKNYRARAFLINVMK